jgi:hypothetical protein
METPTQHDGDDSGSPDFAGRVSTAPSDGASGANYPRDAGDASDGEGSANAGRIAATLAGLLSFSIFRG